MFLYTNPQLYTSHFEDKTVKSNPAWHQIVQKAKRKTEGYSSSAPFYICNDRTFRPHIQWKFQSICCLLNFNILIRDGSKVKLMNYSFAYLAEVGLQKTHWFETGIGKWVQKVPWILKVWFRFRRNVHQSPRTLGPRSDSDNKYC